jgi:uncharacterized protein (UPF0548 family)
MVSLLRPTRGMIEALLELHGKEGVSYQFAGATRKSAPAPAGYDFDHNRICLGKGEGAFAAACTALRHWQMFELGWVEITNPSAPIKPGTTVAMIVRCLGLWWVNICRIIYVIDETGPVRKLGFAYGTTPHHVERGEERFTVEWQETDDSVWYDLYAFSQPAYWMVKLGYPLARRMQRKFAQDSKRAMCHAVAGISARIGRIDK